MAHSLSAKKRIRQTLKRRARNRARKDVMKGEIKTFMSAIGSGDAKKAEVQFRTVTKRLDQIAAKGTIHKNTAARKRSRLARRLNALRNAPKSTAGAGTKAAKA